MPIDDIRALRTLDLPGLRRQTIGGHEQGVRTMEVWLQTMAPGAAPPVHALGMAPVRVRNADGSPLPVPWEAPAPA
jgi:hypothetical protein